MSPEDVAPLRERTRRAVRAELVGAAQRLFIEHGYEDTTVDQIAHAAGMSKRSFFRYFASKDDVILGTYDHHAQMLVERLEARPRDEPIWTSLRRMFDQLTEGPGEGDDRTRARDIARVVDGSAPLRAAHLERLDRMQSRIAEVVLRRAEQHGMPVPGGATGARAIVGAAFASATAAQITTRTSGIELGEALDKAMGAVAECSAFFPHDEDERGGSGSGTEVSRLGSVVR